MKNALKIFVFTIAVSAFYSYVGQMVPQKRTDPPEEVEISADIPTEEMVTIGEGIVAGKGTCLSCHTMGEEGALRFPDLGNIGAIAGSRQEGVSDIQYLAESLYDPNAYIVEGFQAGMPAVHRPPISLNDQEILTVLAYLQSLGGTPTVTMDAQFEWQGQAPAQPAAPAGGGEAPVASNMDGPTLFASYMCATCHSLDGTPGAGPSLGDIGSRMSKGEIYESIMEPDAVVAEGYAPGVMGATLNGVGFFDKVSAKDMQTLVDYLAAQTGN